MGNSGQTDAHGEKLPLCFMHEDETQDLNKASVPLIILAVSNTLIAFLCGQEPFLRTFSVMCPVLR